MNAYLQTTNLCNRVSLTTQEPAQPAFILTVLTPSHDLCEAWLPLNVALVIDGRGAIADEAMRELKRAIKEMVEQLRPIDRLSVVVSGSPAQIVLPSQKIEQLSYIYSMLDQIHNLGGSSLASGLELGIEQVRQNLDPQHTNRLLFLLGDQAGIDADACFSLAEQAGKDRIQILGLGFGDNWQEEFLNALVERSLNAHTTSIPPMIEYIPGLSQRFGQALLNAHQAMQIVARDVVVSTRVMAGVEMREVWQVRPYISSINYETIHGQHIRIRMGDLPRSGAILLIETAMPGRASGDVRVARFVTAYQVPGQEPCSESCDLVLNYAPSVNVTNPLNSDVMDCAELIQAYRLQSQALQALDQNDAQNAGHKLRQAAAILVSQGEMELADLIRREVDYNLRKYGQISEQGRKAIHFYSRRSLKLAEWGG